MPISMKWRPTTAAAGCSSVRIPIIAPGGARRAMSGRTGCGRRRNDCGADFARRAAMALCLRGSYACVGPREGQWGLFAGKYLNTEEDEETRRTTEEVYN